ncbi:Calcineurin-like phosphoesterase [Jatrophihabitans endophyticus]|uniref:Calcineurin-like phosphoesterase n=1 Tax=Jatrophihabitans endophyticus TaxID=1206085 RepID=A0A1M5P274_9ACTN|nr:metallophosphoesterase [Jatrophihabitans endophyticus]SHG95882.1 Calcineurin-like phosphoesterase [Jatrophihabitans endophyticus]
MTRGRVAVIGDLAGHRGELERELARLGARDDRLPDDLTVVQVGDLVHRGPDSEGVVALVDHYLGTQPGRWHQLVGNHEAQYLREPAFDWPEHIDDQAAETLAGWWDARAMVPAVAIRAGHGADAEDFLVTHAGLTAGFWKRALDRPGEARLAAAALNSFAGRHDDVLFAAGQMLGGGKADHTAGPVWAAAASELVASWLGVELPFGQVHGHSTVMDWKHDRLRGEDEVTTLVTVDGEAAVEIVTMPGGRIVGVDPGHGAKPRTPWRAFVLDDAEVLDDAGVRS